MVAPGYKYNYTAQSCLGADGSQYYVHIGSHAEHEVEPCMRLVAMFQHAVLWSHGYVSNEDSVTHF